MLEEVKRALDQIRPSLQMDGGDVQLIDVNDGIVTVRLTGACGGCPMSTVTLKDGIERFVMETVPGVKSVEAV